MDRLNWTTRACFNAVRQLRLAGACEQSSAEALSRQAHRFVDAMIRRAEEARYAHVEIQMMTYAVVALMDEVVMSQPGPVRDYWAQRPLQMQYFNENTAGENFFVHLEQVRKPGGSTDVLRVFYTCLLLGFQGQYAVRGGGAALSDLIESLGRQLSADYRAPELLAPYGVPHETPLRAAAQGLPWVWIGVGAAVLSVLLYLSLQVSLAKHLGSLANVDGYVDVQGAEPSAERRSGSSTSTFLGWRA